MPKPLHAGKPTIPPGKLKPNKADKGDRPGIWWGSYIVDATAIRLIRIDTLSVTPIFENGLELPPATFATAEEAEAFALDLAAEIGLDVPEEEEE